MPRVSWLGFLFYLLFCLSASIVRAEGGVEPKPSVRVGSKIFTESYILAEIFSQLLEDRGYPVERKYGLGGTLVAYEALRSQQIDIYPEYTGTISEVILQSPRPQTFDEIVHAMESRDHVLTKSLGFDNTYALAVTEATAGELDLRTIDDLKGHVLRAAFPFEFMERQDGWRNLRQVYDLNFNIRTLEKALTYEAIEAQRADIIVVYSTDAKVERYRLRVLKDNKDFFPNYEALALMRAGLDKEVYSTLHLLESLIDDSLMRKMNAQAELDGRSFDSIAHEFLVDNGLLQEERVSAPSPYRHIMWGQIFKLTLEHLYLVFFSILLATLVAVPLGVFLFRFPAIAKPTLYIVGLLQTIPSLALLVYMIPWLGVTVEAALMALFLYSLLPILQNTYSGLQNVDPILIQAARGIGLYPREILWSVELPLAMPIIIAGVRVAAVINVGTATIAAFIGSGGLGELIVQGLTLNNMSLMQQGAIPAAILAVLINILFNKVEKLLK